MTVRDTADGKLVFPAEITSDSEQYVGNRWVMITEDSIVSYRANGQKVFDVLVLERDGSEVGENKRKNRSDKARFTVSVIDDRGESVELGIRDTGTCGCGNLLKSVTTLAGAQAKYATSLKRERADEEKAAKRADRRQQAQQRQQERNQRRAAARAANRTKRRKR